MTQPVRNEAAVNTRVCRNLDYLGHRGVKTFTEELQQTPWLERLQEWRRREQRLGMSAGKFSALVAHIKMKAAKAAKAAKIPKPVKTESINTYDPTAPKSDEQRANMSAAAVRRWNKDKAAEQRAKDAAYNREYYLSHRGAGDKRAYNKANTVVAVD